MLVVQSGGILTDLRRAATLAAYLLQVADMMSIELPWRSTREFNSSLTLEGVVDCSLKLNVHSEDQTKTRYPKRAGSKSISFSHTNHATLLLDSRYPVCASARQCHGIHDGRQDSEGSRWRGLLCRRNHSNRSVLRCPLDFFQDLLVLAHDRERVHLAWH